MFAAHLERGRQVLPAGLFSDCGGELAGTTETRNVLFLAPAA